MDFSHGRELKDPDNYQNVNLKLRAVSFEFCDLFEIYFNVVIYLKGFDFFPFGMFWSWLLVITGYFL